MSQVLVSSQIDWVTITRPLLNTDIHGLVRGARIEKSLELIARDLELGENVFWQPRMKSKNYGHTFAHAETGITVDIPYDGDESQGLRIIAPGGSWLMRSVKSLRAMLSKGWSPTRVDHCWNVQGAEFDILKMYLAWRESSPKSGKMKPDIEGDKRKGETFTIGSRHSDFYVRIYDKEKQSDLKTGRFLRIEFELKGDYVKALYEGDFQHVDNTAMALYSKAGFFPGLPVIHSVMAGVAADVVQTGEVVVGRKQTDREKWMRTQVIPSFRKLCVEDRMAALEIAEIMAAIVGATGD